MEQSKRQREKDSSSSCHGSVICFYNITKPHHFISTWNHDFFGFTRYLKVWLLYFSVSALKKLTDIRHDTLDSHNEQYISLVKTMTRWLTQIIIIKKRNTKVNLKKTNTFFFLHFHKWLFWSWSIYSCSLALPGPHDGSWIEVFPFHSQTGSTDITRPERELRLSIKLHQNHFIFVQD